MSPRTFYRTIATAEAVTWTLLIAAMILKYGVKVGDWPVSIAGFAHGLVFIAYVVTAILVGLNQRWPKGLIVVAAATSVIPYLTIPFTKWLENKGRLDGAWRTTVSDHPGDGKWADVALRAMIGRPVLLGVTFVVVVGGVMATMLFVGPPGGRA
ncbi:integral membrane protein [Arthrobacter alpinus]|uniref:Integral membrane protein n=1 Tax=Arthrobacter alpinus TaxID=656366 RepID=A0A0U3QYX9_9MICC|nr:DUF3817 domain-containing protein [Arthrobacter alpinus]ALV45652.1 hypothetical protein MB46_09280 [Arthrobacter alpinus]SEE06754.1 integral membrane protein [Arthrobacter alpinus]